MHHLKTAAIAIAIVCSTAISSAYAQSAPTHLMVKPDELKWAPLGSLPCGAQAAVIEGPMNEAKPFTVRIKFPADCKIMPHWHPAVEHVTVVSGAFGMGVGDAHDAQKGMILPVGSVAIMQPNAHHFGWTTQETIVQIHGVGPWGITYVNPADDPTKKTN